jgi:hypothetical protein
MERREKRKKRRRSGRIQENIYLILRTQRYVSAYGGGKTELIR